MSATLLKFQAISLSLFYPVDCRMPYNYWQNDSELYKASLADPPSVVTQCDIHIQPSYNASFNHLHSPSSNDPFVNNPESSGNIYESSPIGGQPDPVHDSPPTPLTSSSLYVCKWNDGHGPCDMILNEREMKNHIPSHLPRGSRLTLLRCQWEGCARQRPMRRDTIIRHIRQIELGISPRRQ